MIVVTFEEFVVFETFLLSYVVAFVVVELLDVSLLPACEELFVGVVALFELLFIVTVVAVLLVAARNLRFPLEVVLCMIAD